MKRASARLLLRLWPLLGPLLVPGLLAGCSSPRPIPLPDLNGMLRQNVGSRRDPALAQRWLASLALRGGRERVELMDLGSRQACGVSRCGNALRLEPCRISEYLLVAHVTVVLDDLKQYLRR